MPVRLVDRVPEVAPEGLVAAMVPPPRFVDVRFDNYLPDPGQPSQAAALLRLQEFAAGLAPVARRFRRRRPAGVPGVYLDGGFGVGKTHLLAALWHAAPAPKAYGTFVEVTHLVGALGFARAADVLSGHRLLCIDEFELDDPGDTVLVASLIARLVREGVRVATTSNTLPGALGEGRFATGDFRREISGLSSHFTSIRVDGDDYRHRGVPAAPEPVSDAEVARRAQAGTAASYDDFTSLLRHVATLHPSRYGALLDGVELVCLRRVEPVADQAVALRLVVLVDRLYDRDLPVVTSGVPLDRVFPPELLAGGYRKKYLRAISRLTALARSGPAAPGGLLAT